MMRLILVRHGETEHNRGNVTLGRFDAPLNARGLLQAEAVAASFVGAGAGSKDRAATHVPSSDMATLVSSNDRAMPDAIYTSPLARAAVTAAGIGAAVGVDVAVDDDLIEMDVGEMEHLTGGELRERYPEFLRLWMSDGCADARMPGGGETLREVQARALSSVGRLFERHGGSSVVVVTHNFVIQTLVSAILGLPVSSFRRLRVAVGSKTVVEVASVPGGAQLRGIAEGEPGAWGGGQLVRLNDISHLVAAGPADDLLKKEARS